MTVFNMELTDLSNWEKTTDEAGQASAYEAHSDIEEYHVVYKLYRISDNKWKARIAADGHVTFRPLHTYEDAESAKDAIVKRCTSY